MKYEFSWMAFLVFSFFVGAVLALSFFLGRKAKSAKGYYAAHGQIHWFVNGVAFAGDYLSAASFLGICGMIAFFGFDGFLYSIGFLGGWIVALLVIAEPLKRLGKFTFADALDAKFNSRGIKLTAAISTLIVSLFYLIPQMVGAGTLIRPLLGLPSHRHGIGELCDRRADRGDRGHVDCGDGGHGVDDLGAVHQGIAAGDLLPGADGHDPAARADGRSEPGPPQVVLTSADKSSTLVDGKPQGHGSGQADLIPIGTVAELPGGARRDRPARPDPIHHHSAKQQSRAVEQERDTSCPTAARRRSTAPKSTDGNDILLPGKIRPSQAYAATNSSTSSISFH